jgi:hypothetical protein
LKSERLKKPLDKQAVLKKKIEEAEQQLAKAAASFTASSSIVKETTNPQTDSTITLTTMTEKKMVAPGSKDAPRFRSSKPEELRRFIRLMEDLWQTAGITDDETKISTIGKYADQDSEEEWEAFESFGEGHSWTDFKNELIANYPEAAAAERGTPARIRQICADTSKVRLGDMVALYKFRRSFMSEAKKLQKPPVTIFTRVPTSHMLIPFSVLPSSSFLTSFIFTS